MQSVCLRNWIGVVVAVAFSQTLEAQVGSPAGPVPVEILTARRQAIMAAMGSGVAVFGSAEVRTIEADGSHPQDSEFRQDNDFFYLTGLETPDSWLVLVARPDSAGTAVLFLPPRDSAAERWTGPKLGPGAEAEALTGIETVLPATDAEREITRLVFGSRSAAWTGGMYVRRGHGRPDAEAELVRELVFRSTGRPLPVHDLGYVIAQERLVKDDDELRRMRRAIDITAEAQREALRIIQAGMWEYEIEAVIEYTFRRNGAERVGFPSIVGAGVNSTTLHYDKSRGLLEDGDLIIMDVGAEFGYYSADVTRTAPVSGRFTERQRALYELVLATQQTAIDSVRPGVTVGDLNRISRTYMSEHSGDLCQPTDCNRFYVHGLSHWLGMDVHDVGDYSTPLAQGMVLTIEPGIYLPDERIGIRIEDDVLVTETGHEVLSAASPRSVEDIESLMYR
ncbi:MAG: aminopeptidase P N-terminal domain-containing protein [Gemmatimonadales bacterium]